MWIKHKFASASCTCLLPSVRNRVQVFKQRVTDISLQQQLSHLSLMKPAGSTQVISSSRWDSVSAAAVVSLSQPRCCCRHRLTEVPRCLCNPFIPFRSYSKVWTDGKQWHTWQGVTETLRSSSGLCVVAKRRRKSGCCAFMCTLWNGIPFSHLHLYDRISSWSYCGKRSCFHHRKAPLTPVKILCLSHLIEGLKCLSYSLVYW